MHERWAFADGVGTGLRGALRAHIENIRPVAAGAGLFLRVCDGLFGDEAAIGLRGALTGGAEQMAFRGRGAAETPVDSALHSGAASAEAAGSQAPRLKTQRACLSFFRYSPAHMKRAERKDDDGYDRS